MNSSFEALPEAPNRLQASDRIVFPELDFEARVGILPGESDRPQPLRARVEVCLDLHAAGASDRVEDSFDYRQIEDIVTASVAEPAGLLESLAHRFLDALLADPRVCEARVGLHKVRAPLGAAVGPIVVELQRQRGSQS